MRALGRGAVHATRWPPLCLWAAAPPPGGRARRLCCSAGAGAVPTQRGGGGGGGNSSSSKAGPPAEDTITSTGNAFVKHCVKLREKARYRREQGRLLLVGSTIIRELTEFGAPLRVATLMLQPGAPSPLPPRLRPERVVRVTGAVARKVSGLETFGASDAIVELDLSGSGLSGVAELRAAFGVAAACATGAHGGGGPPQEELGQQEQRQGQGVRRPPPGGGARLRRLLALEAVQDPGNLGTLLRCAIAFGWDAVLLLPGCCDPFNEKALRASRGAALRMALAEGSWEELSSLAEDAGLLLLAAEPEEEAQGGPSQQHQQQQQRRQGEQRQGERRQGEPGAGVAVCLVLGSEGQGLSATALRRCRPVAIPMVGQMESLNVSVAGGILMFMLSEGVPPLSRRLEGLGAHTPGTGAEP